MKTILLFLTGVALATSAIAQSMDQRCACKKFPYMYCDPTRNTPIVECVDDPTVALDGGSITPLHPHLYTCIKHGIDPDTLDTFDGETPGNLPGYGWIWNGSVYVPGVNICNQDYPGGNYRSIGGLMGGPNYSPLESQWSFDLSEALGGCALTDHTSCCIGIVFQTDPDWYRLRGLDPHVTVGYDDPFSNYDAVNCERTCGDHTININVTSKLLFNLDSIDWDHPPTQMVVNYVADNGTGGIPQHDAVVGEWYNWNTKKWEWNGDNQHVYAENTIDFMSVIMHEMGHWVGLPDRGTHSANVSGYCGDPDPNSIMNNINSGVERNTIRSGSDDACWLKKLYCPAQLPKCLTDEVADVIEPSHLDLEQSHPNPTTGAATIGFDIDRAARVTLVVYNVLGKQVLTLLSYSLVTAGHHDITISAGSLPSGKYIYTLTDGLHVRSRQMTILK